MDPVPAATLVAGKGLAGNADQGGRRQVTLISEEVWQALPFSVPPVARRANVMLRGLDLARSRGRILRISSATLRIFGETKPCYVLDAAHPGLKDALHPNWGGGAAAEVLEGGEIRVGDEAWWEESETIAAFASLMTRR